MQVVHTKAIFTMRPKSIVLLLLALGCGLVAAVGINDALSRPVGEQEATPTTEIVVALTEIQTGDPIKAEMIKLESWPQDKVPPGAVTSLEGLTERRAKSKLYPGEPLIDGKLFAKGESGAGVTDDIPLGMKIATVKVDAVSGLAGLVKPGDRVDVLVHLTENPAKGILKTSTISPKNLQNVTVKAIDNVFERDKNGEQQVTAKTITLLVTPSQAQLVMFASEVGQIRFIGRNVNDTTSDEQTVAVSVAELLNGLKEGDAGQAPDLLKQIQAALVPEPKSEPVVVQKLTPPEPPKDLFRMMIMEGGTARQVQFENGVLVTPELGGGEAAASPSPAFEPEEVEVKEENSARLR